MMAHFKEEEPRITVTLSFFLFIARIFLNRCKKFQNRQNLEFFILLKFDLSFQKY